MGARRSIGSGRRMMTHPFAATKIKAPPEPPPSCSSLVYLSCFGRVYTVVNTTSRVGSVLPVGHFRGCFYGTVLVDVGPGCHGALRPSCCRVISFLLPAFLLSYLFICLFLHVCRWAHAEVVPFMLLAFPPLLCFLSRSFGGYFQS